MAYTKLTDEAELPGEGEAKEFELGEKTICVAHLNGKIVAMDNLCLHMGGPLGQGFIDGNKLVCPWHGWEYDLGTGQVADDPEGKLAFYPVKIENGEVLIEI